MKKHFLMRSKPVAMFVILMASALWSTFAHACSCGLSGSSCGVRPARANMFLAKVLKQRVVDENKELSNSTVIGVRLRVVTLSVVEDFGTGYHPGEEVEVETGMGGGDCGYNFRDGERYLIDAYSYGGKLSVGICGSTAPETAAGRMLRMLRQPSRTTWPDLSGSVIRYSASSGPNSQMPQPMSNIPVSISGMNGFHVRTTTQADGVYELARLPAGIYDVVFDVPAGLEGWGRENHRTVAIPITSSNGADCELSLAVNSAGRLQGHIISGSGETTMGVLSVYSHAPGGTRPEYWNPTNFIGSDGEFDLGPLDAGTYWLTFVSRTNTDDRWYYPGTRDASQAKPIIVEQGKPITGLTFTVTP